VNPFTRTLDRLGTRNRNLNSPIVGVDAALYAARCVVTNLLFWILAVVWIVVYVGAVASRARQVETDSVLLLIVLGCPLAWLGYRFSAIAARLAADHLEKELGFRPRWWACYSMPRGWNGAIKRQKRWHTRGRWPLITW
jgi:hypothetical protein